MNYETKSVSFASDGHPDENQILLALERELPPDEASLVEQHLGNCWSCRARSEEMQRGILAFVEYREKRYLPSIATPPADYSGFRGKLRSVAGNDRSVGTWARIWRKITSLFALPGQVRWISVVATAMAMIIFWVEVLQPPAVSASELLRRAAVAQNPSVTSDAGAQNQIAHQRVEIRSSNRTVVREFEWTLGKPIPGSEWEKRPDASFWDAPLTAEGFAGWRNSLQGKRDKVKRNGNFLKLDTIANSNFIKEAWIVVRAGDFHPVEQHLRFTDDRQLDFTELSFNISERPRATSKPSVPINNEPSQLAKTPKVALPSEADLAETELQLRYALFTHQWDLGEDLTIGRVPGLVTLNGVVSSAERERAMRTSLGTLPNVRLSISAPNTLHGPPSKSIGAPTVKDVTRSTPLLSEALEKRFTTREARLAFVDRCLSASDAELSNAWALKGLAERYSDMAERLLRADSQSKLHEMLHAHLQQVSRAESQLRPLLDILPASAESLPGATPSNWQAATLSLFAQVQQEDELVSNLIVGTQGANQDLPKASADLRLAHERIEALLVGLNHTAGNNTVQ